MESTYNKVLLFGLLIFGLSLFLALPSVSLGATATVTAGCPGPQCLGEGLGFVDDASGTGGFATRARTTVNVGDTVRWHWEAGGPHTAAAQPGLGSNIASPCGTGDNFSSGLLLPTRRTFEHTFAAAGTCAYFCQVHSAAFMQGEVIVAGPTTTVTTSSTTTTSRPATTTTTSTTVGGTTTSLSVTTTSVRTTTTSIRPTTTTNPNLGKILELVNDQLQIQADILNLNLDLATQNQRKFRTDLQKLRADEQELIKDLLQ